MSKKQQQEEPRQYRGNPEIVVAILEERGRTDPFIREIIRGAILEAALIEATQESDAG